MKTLRSMIVAMIAVSMILASVSLAFAEDTTGESGQPATTEQPAETTQPAKPTTIPAPDQVKNLKSLSSYKSIKLTWSKVADKSNGNGEGIKYEVYRRKVEKGKTNKYKKIATTNKTTYTDKNLNPRYNFQYKVRATNKSKVGEKKNMTGKYSAVVKDSPVKPAFIRLTTAKTGRYFSAKTGYSTAGYFGRNKTIYAEGGIAGRYAVPLKPSKMGNDNAGYYNIDSSRNVKMYLGTKEAKYTKAEKELYVNTRKLKSKTNYLVWVSTYKQEVYIFKKVKGKWVYKEGYGCNTGKVRTPTPTGVLKLHGKQRYFKSTRGNGYLQYMSKIYSDTGFHKNFPGTPLRQPASAGCIRVAESTASYIYYNIPKNTTVLVY